jgi:segregation and condensation protein B
MFGTTREFLDYFGLKKLEDLPTLAEIKDSFPELSPQTDLIDALRSADGETAETGASVAVLATTVDSILSADSEADEEDDSELIGPDLLRGDGDEGPGRRADPADEEEDDAAVQSAEVIPLRAADDQ